MSSLISVMTAAWRRLVGPTGRNGTSHDGEPASLKVCELTWQSGGAAVWPVEWVDWADPGGASINANGSHRTAGLEWDAPPSVDDVEAVLQANLGAQIRTIGQHEVAIRAPRDSSA